MSMLNTHGMMHVSAAGTGAGAATSVSYSVHGLAAASLRGLGIALLALTIIFAIGAIRGLLPRRAELRARREQRASLAPPARRELTVRGSDSR
jgi:hypothetical protein